MVVDTGADGAGRGRDVATNEALLKVDELELGELRA
jgi:hypothetical protein